MIDRDSLSERRVNARRIATTLLLGLEGLLTLSTLYLLALLGAAASTLRVRQTSPPAMDADDRLHIIVLIPAHNEEAGIGKTLASLACLLYPKDRFEVVVIADNCQDRTAELAWAAGVTVYERTDPAQRGKGYALAWGLERLRLDRPTAEVLVILDADCEPSPNLLAAIETRLRSGASAVQTNYVVANPKESWSSGLRFAAFALINTVRPLGKERLGLSCGLLGTGMGFTRSLLDRQVWKAFSITEDGEYHLQLVDSGERVVFIPEASVTSAMPTSLRGAREQQLRWEGGRWRLVGAWVPKLLRSGLQRRDPVRLHAALELLILPQSLLLAGTTLSAALAVGLRSRTVTAFAAVNLIGQAYYIVGGLRLVQAPAAAYRALVMAPLLMIWKVGLYMRVVAGRGPRSWVRTRREGTDREW